METDNEHDENNVADKSMAFSKKEDMIALLRAIFIHGSLDLPSDILPNKSVEERQRAMKLAYEQAKNNVKDMPTVVDWLQSGLFVNEESNIPLALLFIEWYEQHPLSHQENEECNFREIYHFLYKMVMNQPMPQLSRNSAKVLYTLLSEITNEVWPSAQNEVLDYLRQTYNYSRQGIRRTYSKKR